MKSAVAVQGNVSGVDVVASPEVFRSLARNAVHNRMMETAFPMRSELLDTNFHRTRSVVRNTLNMKAVRTIFKGAMRQAEMSWY